MKISLVPQRRDDTLTISKAGDILTVNGEAFDFSGVVDGTPLLRENVACDWLASDVERVNGELNLSLIMPHGPDAPAGTKFPAPITVTADGAIDLPPPNGAA